MDRPATRRLTARIRPEEDGFVIQCVENGVTTEGDTYAEALRNIREAVELYYEDGATGSAVLFDLKVSG